jgi:hypothetical protein
MDSDVSLLAGLFRIYEELEGEVPVHPAARMWQAGSLEELAHHANGKFCRRRPNRRPSRLGSARS